MIGCSRIGFRLEFPVPVFFRQRQSMQCKSWQHGIFPTLKSFFYSPRELKEDYVQKLAQICKQAGIRVASVHPFTSGSESLYFFSEYPGRFEDGLEIYRNYFRAAQILGAQLLVFHGDSPYSKMPLEKGFEQINRWTFWHNGNMVSALPMKT